MYKDNLIITVGDNISYTRRMFTFPAIFLTDDDFNEDGKYEGCDDDYSKEELRRKVAYDQGYLLVNIDESWWRIRALVNQLINFNNLPLGHDEDNFYDEDVFIGIHIYSENNGFNVEYFKSGEESYRDEYYVFCRDENSDAKYGDNNADFMDEYEHSLMKLLSRDEGLIIEPECD